MSTLPWLLSPAAPRSALIAATAWLTDRELRRLAFGCLSLGTGQRGANEPPMHGTVVVEPGRFGGVQRVVVHDVGGYQIIKEHGVTAVEHGVIVRRGSGHDESSRLTGICLCQRQLAGLAPSRDRDLCLFVLVFRVAGGATCLPDLVFDHGDNRMVGDAALTRAVVVENVTEPKPALLHELPRNASFQLGWVSIERGYPAV